MRIAVRHRQQQCDRAAERGDLREREVDEDDPPLDNMKPEVRMDTGQNQACDKRRRKELDDLAEREVGPHQWPVAVLRAEASSSTL